MRTVAGLVWGMRESDILRMVLAAWLARVLSPHVHVWRRGVWSCPCWFFTMNVGRTLALEGDGT
jgi:hypothetical protein